MTTIHVEAVDLLAIAGKCKEIKDHAVQLKATGHDQELLFIERHLEAITDVVIEAAKAEFGKVEA
jgi:hypothetical protein